MKSQLVFPVDVSISFLSAPALFAFRAATTMVKPFFASSSAVTLPTPSVAPVIRQIGFFISRRLACVLRFQALAPLWTGRRAEPLKARGPRRGWDARTHA